MAGALGAVARFALSHWVYERSRGELPVGTATVNLLGAFLLGVVVGGGDPDAVLEMAAIGFLGGFTTFSTWIVETVRLGRSPAVGWGAAALNAVVTLVAGVALAGLGHAVAS